MVLDRFFKMSHFISCKKISYASSIFELFSCNVRKLYGVPKTITYDYDVKFISQLMFSHFMETIQHNLVT